MIELAVIPAGTIRLLQRQDRDVLLGRERPHLPPEAVPDLLHQRRRRHRKPEMVSQKHDHLAGDLQPGHIGVQIQPVHAVNL